MLANFNFGVFITIDTMYLLYSFDVLDFFGISKLVLCNRDDTVQQLK